MVGIWSITVRPAIVEVEIVAGLVNHFGCFGGIVAVSCLSAGECS